MNTNDLERMLALVSAELLEWKRLMPRWADVVSAYVTPSITGAMWMPVVGVCARSKGCTNCPHSLSWRKLVQIRIPDAMREAGLKRGEAVPKFFYRWSNKPQDKAKDGLPQNLHCGPELRRAYRDFEAVRRTIMDNHTALVTLHKRLKCQQREACWHTSTGKNEPIADLVLNVLMHNEARQKTDRAVWELQSQYPPAKVWNY